MVGVVVMTFGRVWVLSMIGREVWKASADIAGPGACDVFLIMDANSVDEDIHSDIPFEGKGEPRRLGIKL